MSDFTDFYTTFTCLPVYCGHLLNVNGCEEQCTVQSPTIFFTEDPRIDWLAIA